MHLAKPDQELRNDLRGAASALESAAQDLFSAAKSCAEPEFYIYMEKIGKLYVHIDKLMLLADQVGEGLIITTSLE
ncbi:hypothetical protein D8M30_13525 [Corynebacterium pseudodiphtheriticum]|nr:hypothetical protein D8M30_13525 [Corynebacterium pseudodiphtheriticum]